MITIPNLDYTSDIKVPDALRGATKSEMFKVVRKLDFFVSQDLDGEVLVTRFAEELIKPTSRFYVPWVNKNLKSSKNLSPDAQILMS